jgi:trehalose 6-phosphate synthase
MSFSWHHPLIEYLAIGIAAILLIIVAVTPLVTAIVEGWSRRDVELRSRLVFRSIEDRVANAIRVARSSGLTNYFERLAEDEKLIALGFCDESGALFYATNLLPRASDARTCREGPSGRLQRFAPARAAISSACFPFLRERRRATSFF